MKEKKVKLISLSEMVPGILKYVPGMEKMKTLLVLKGLPMEAEEGKYQSMFLASP